MQILYNNGMQEKTIIKQPTPRMQYEITQTRKQGTTNQFRKQGP